MDIPEAIEVLDDILSRAEQQHAADCETCQRGRAALNRLKARLDWYAQKEDR